MRTERLFTQGEVKKIFPHIPANTLLHWAREGLVPWTEERVDGRGVHRLYSLHNLFALAVAEKMLSWGVEPKVVREISPMPGAVKSDYVAVQELDLPGEKPFRVTFIRKEGSFDLLKEKEFKICMIIDVGQIREEITKRTKDIEI